MPHHYTTAKRLSELIPSQGFRFPPSGIILGSEMRDQVVERAFWRVIDGRYPTRSDVAELLCHLFDQANKQLGKRRMDRKWYWAEVAEAWKTVKGVDLHADDVRDLALTIARAERKYNARSRDKGTTLPLLVRHFNDYMKTQEPHRDEAMEFLEEVRVAALGLYPNSFSQPTITIPWTDLAPQANADDTNNEMAIDDAAEENVDGSDDGGEAAEDEEYDEAVQEQRFAEGEVEVDETLARWESEKQNGSIGQGEDDDIQTCDDNVQGPDGDTDMADTNMADTDMADTDMVDTDAEMIDTNVQPANDQCETSSHHFEMMETDDASPTDTVSAIKTRNKAQLPPVALKKTEEQLARDREKDQENLPIFVQMVQEGLPEEKADQEAKKKAKEEAEKKADAERAEETMKQAREQIEQFKSQMTLPVRGPPGRL